MNKSGKPKGYSAGRKKKAIFSGTAIVPNGQRHIFERAIGCFSKKLSISNERITGKNPRCTLQFDVSYTSVGAWRSDVAKKINAGLVKAGSTAQCIIINDKRTVIQN